MNLIKSFDKFKKKLEQFNEHLKNNFNTLENQVAQISCIENKKILKIP